MKASSLAMFVAIFVFPLSHFVECSANACTNKLSRSNRARIIGLLNELRALRPMGDSYGGPYIGVVPNQVTRKIVKHGKAAIPVLLARLTTAELNESIFIVLCLHELKAKEATAAIKSLEKDLQARKKVRTA